MKITTLGPQSTRWLKDAMRRGNSASGSQYAINVSEGIEYPHPFRVQYSKQIDDGAGGFIIWLPGGELMSNGAQMSIAETDNGSLEDADPYSAKWLRLSLVSGSATSIFLHISHSSSEGAENQIETWFDESSTGGEWNVLVASIETDDDDDRIRRIKNRVTSVLTIGDEMDVDDVSIEVHEGGTSMEPKPEHAIKGWHDADASSTKLGDLLTGESEDTSRQILVRNGKGGATEYLPIGRVSAAVDDVSIEEYDSGTPEEPKPEHAIKGWHYADAGSTKLGDLLGQSTEDTSRQILVRNGKESAPEFMPIGRVGNGKIEFYSLNNVKISEFSANQATDSARVDIPLSANDAQITIKQGGVEKGVFTVNQAENQTIELDAGGGGAVTGGTYIDVNGGVVDAKVLTPNASTPALVTSDTVQNVYKTKTLATDTQNALVVKHANAGNDDTVSFVNGNGDQTGALTSTTGSRQIALRAFNPTSPNAYYSGVKLSVSADSPPEPKQELENPAVSDAKDIDEVASVQIATVGWTNDKFVRNAVVNTKSSQPTLDFYGGKQNGVDVLLFSIPLVAHSSLESHD